MAKAKKGIPGKPFPAASAKDKFSGKIGGPANSKGVKNYGKGRG